MAHIATEFTCVYYATAGTIFGTTEVYELGLSYISISIFKKIHFLIEHIFLLLFVIFFEKRIFLKDSYTIFEGKKWSPYTLLLAFLSVDDYSFSPNTSMFTILLHVYIFKENFLKFDTIFARVLQENINQFSPMHFTATAQNVGRKKFLKKKNLG